VATIGLIADTHGTLPSAALDVFEGVDRVLHAGDVGSDDVLVMLRTLGPVTAVSGNMDKTGPQSQLPSVAEVEAHGVRFRVVHHEGPRACAEAAEDGIDVLVVGHTHRPRLERCFGVLCVNPGSATQDASGDGASVAVAEVGGGGVEIRIVRL
jgi:putative phosphoesterase